MGKTEIGYASLLEQKLAALKEILSLTQKSAFDDESHDTDQRAEIYVSLYDKREALFRKIAGIDNQLKLAEQAAPPDEGCRRVAAECSAAAREILALDIKAASAAEEIMADIKVKLREIKQGRSASTVYHNEAVFSSGLFYDKKN